MTNGNSEFMNEIIRARQQRAKSRLQNNDTINQTGESPDANVKPVNENNTSQIINKNEQKDSDNKDTIKTRLQNEMLEKETGSSSGSSMNNLAPYELTRLKREQARKQKEVNLDKNEISDNNTNSRLQNSNTSSDSSNLQASATTATSEAQAVNKKAEASKQGIISKRKAKEEKTVNENNPNLSFKEKLNKQYLKDKADELKEVDYKEQAEKVYKKSKKNGALYITLSIVIVLCLTYVVGALKSMFKGDIDFSILGALKNALGSLKGIIFFILAIGVAILVSTILKNFTREKEQPEVNLTLTDSNAHGSAQKGMTEYEMNTYLSKVNKVTDADNIVYGRLVGKKEIVARKETTGLNGNTLIVGSPGSLKTTAIILNTIERLSAIGRSMVISDLKGELYDLTADILEKRGYEVKVFNTENILASDSWDILGACQSDDDVETMVTVMMEAARGKGEREDYYYKIGSSLLRALLYYTKKNPNVPNDERTLRTAFEFLQTKNTEQLKSMFGAIVNSLDVAKSNFFSINQEKGVEAARSNLSNDLHDFHSQIVKELVSYDDIKLENLGQKKCAYFIIKPEASNKYAYLSTLFVSFAFTTLAKQAKNNRANNRKLNVPVTFILDEFANLAPRGIPNFDKILSTVRGYGVDVCIAIQSIPQLTEVYGEAVGQQILNNCSTQILMGTGSDNVTDVYFSKLTGETTAETSSVSKNMTGLGLFGGAEYTETKSMTSRYTYTPHEIRQLMIRKHLLLTIQGSNALELEKLYYKEENEAFADAKEVSTLDRTPNWVLHALEETDWNEEKKYRRGGIYKYFDNNLNDIPDYFIEKFEAFEKEYEEKAKKDKNKKAKDCSRDDQKGSEDKETVNEKEKLAESQESKETNKTPGKADQTEKPQAVNKNNKTQKSPESPPATKKTVNEKQKKKTPKYSKEELKQEEFDISDFLG